MDASLYTNLLNAWRLNEISAHICVDGFYMMVLKFYKRVLFIFSNMQILIFDLFTRHKCLENFLPESQWRSDLND
jgi:TRAP-type C4-dicarboxylate transport system permease small subunit